ncbi:MAG TPA: HD domain-containing protein [Candidatus Acidoferrum sp.]|nr:HD domain-containing protein [Candidatus Acidoferrum sp.]
MGTSTGSAGYRQLIAEYIREHAKPADKFSHQPRLYALAKRLAEGNAYDDDVLYAAAWMHDLGVFIGHRPEDPAELARWDNVAYAMRETPALLQRFGFPSEKIPAVLEVIRTHQPSAQPTCFEAVVLRDADILEQMGAVGILRTVSKVGRDTRFVRFSDALTVLRKNADELPGKLGLDAARRLAEPRLEALRSFLQAANAETGTIEW